MFAKIRRGVYAVDVYLLRAVFVIFYIHFKRFEHFTDFFFVFYVDSVAQSKIRRGTIHCTGIEIDYTKVFCHRFGDCAFARSRRSVDCNIYHIPSENQMRFISFVFQRVI